MKHPRRLIKPLLWLHLVVCFAWLCLLREYEQPAWAGHLILWSILGVQFTWGLTVGLIVGPSRKRRSLLWWSLLTVFMPLIPLTSIVAFIGLYTNLLVALVYLGIFTMILACETFCGVLLGAKLHGVDEDSKAD